VEYKWLLNFSGLSDSLENQSSFKQSSFTSSSGN